MSERLRFAPLTAERFADLERLFGPRGACGGCWCMFWRLPGKQFQAGKGEPNRLALAGIARAGEVAGLIAYAGDEPVGWCSLGPRDVFPRLARSRVLKPVDGEPVWSVVCFYVAKGWRRKGLTTKLLAAASAYAREQGAKLLEGYPVAPRSGTMPDVFAYTGIESAFRGAGFREVARRSETRPILRLPLAPPRKRAARSKAPRR